METININIANEEEELSIKSFYFPCNTLVFYMFSANYWVSYTTQIFSKSDWGSTSTVLMFMFYWGEQMIGNCMYLL